MEVAIAGAAEVGRVGRRLFHRIWDPEPINDRAANEPVWCLGRSYTLDTKTYGPPQTATGETSTSISSAADTSHSLDPPRAPEAAVNPKIAAEITGPVPARSDLPDITGTPPDSASSSFEASLAYEEPGQDGGWPPAFLDDFESRVWMTYRTGFPMIPRSPDPKATSTLSFSMRLKTSFGDQLGGFTSDTGWGCMIRSGQSLLANAILIARLGRGMLSPSGYWGLSADSSLQNGGVRQIRAQRPIFWLSLQMTHEHPTLYTNLSATALLLAESFPGSGSAPRPLPAVSSESLPFEELETA